MSDRYHVRNIDEIFSPGLVIFLPLLKENLQQLIKIAGDVRRLRPHCKTHKMPNVVALERSLGIEKHKCATVAEAEMLAKEGVTDILLAYNLVGPNIARAVRFREVFPAVTLSVTADHPDPIRALGAAMSAAGAEIDVLLDIDTGMHRTGIMMGSEAVRLYQLIGATSGLKPGGLHVYDGQNHQTDFAERQRAVRAIWNDVLDFRRKLTDAGCAVPRVVAGGTGTFPCFAELDDPALELSPGTSVFHDVGYGEEFPEMPFVPAALLLTRVVSRPGTNLLTCDLGYKAVASDPPAGKRVEFPALPGAKQVLQNEEHLVLESSAAERYAPGDALWAIPRHICPTSALHREAWVVDHGLVIAKWPVTARDRQLTI